MTLLIALWGAFLSTWVYIQDQRDEAPRVYVRLDLMGAGRKASGQPFGELVVVFFNVGKSTLSMGPRVPIEITDNRTRKQLAVDAKFVKLSRDKTLSESTVFTGGPATLDPGESAVAKTGAFDVSGIDPLDHFSVKFELPDHDQYRASIVAPEYLRRGGESNTFEGWSAGAFAEESEEH